MLNLLGESSESKAIQVGRRAGGERHCPGTMALTVCVRRLTGLPGTHDRQVRLSFRGEVCRDALRIFRYGKLWPLLSAGPPLHLWASLQFVSFVLEPNVSISLPPSLRIFYGSLRVSPGSLDSGPRVDGEMICVCVGGGGDK